MSSRRYHILLFVIGFGALLLLGRLQVGALDHKLLLIGWTVVFYGALAISEYPYVQSSSLRESSPYAAKRVDEFFDEDRIAMQQDIYHWDQDTVMDNASDSL